MSRHFDDRTPVPKAAAGRRKRALCVFCVLSSLLPDARVLPARPRRWRRAGPVPASRRLAAEVRRDVGKAKAVGTLWDVEY